ncbi:MAG: hypothetical protein L6R28_14420 [Planctomycetes bacterium]|nr:hypothetical protein [Planctomycetota bacterium]
MNVYRSRSNRTPPRPPQAGRVELTREAWLRWAMALAAAVILLLGAGLARGVEGGTTSGGKQVKVYEGNPNADVLEKRLKKAYEDAQKEQAAKDAAKKDGNGKDGAQGKDGAKGKDGKDPLKDPEYKEKVALSEERIKELFTNAELKYEEGSYREAGAFYYQVMQARDDAALPKAQDLVKKATDKVLAMDGLAKQHLDNAKDADVKRDFMKEIEELGELVKQFPFAKCYDEARERLTALKNRKEVAGHVELAEAEELAAAGKLSAAIELLKKIQENPRYQNSIVTMKAARRLQELNEGDAAKERLQQEREALAESEAPKLMATAKNFILNKETSRAKEQLNAIIEKFPGTKYAEEAKSKLDELP